MLREIFKGKEKLVVLILAISVIVVAASTAYYLSLYPTGTYVKYVDKIGVSSEYPLVAQFKERIPLTEEEALECNEPFTGRYVMQPLFTGTVRFYQDGVFLKEVQADACGTIGRSGYPTNHPVAALDFKVPAYSVGTFKLPPVEGYIDQTGKIVVTKEPITTIRIELVGYFKGRQVVTDSGSFSVQVKLSRAALQPTPTPTPTPTPPPTTPPTAPSPPVNIWNILQGIWDRIMSWLKTIFGFRIVTERLEVVTGDIAYPGDTFQHTFTLQNTKTMSIPDTDYTDGTASFAYTAWMIVDENGNIVYKGSVNQVNLSPGQTVTVPVTWSIPSYQPVGKYAISAILIEIPMHWDRTQQRWIQDEAVIIDKQAVELNISTITPPPPPGDIWSQIQAWWQSFLEWLKNLFGWR